MLDGFYQKRPQVSLKNIWLSPDKRLEMFPDVLKGSSGVTLNCGQLFGSLLGL